MPGYLKPHTNSQGVRALQHDDGTPCMLTHEQLFKFSEAIRLLIEKTQQGKVEWSCDVADNGKVYKWQSETFRLTLVEVPDRRMGNYQTLSLANGDGTQLALFYGNHPHGVKNIDVVKLSKLLYEQFAKPVLKEKHKAIDEIMDELDSLDSNDVLGEQVKPKTYTTDFEIKDDEPKKNFFQRLFSRKNKSNDKYEK